MGPPSDLNRPGYAPRNKEPHHISDVVSAHADFGVPRTSMAFDDRWLKRFGHGEQNGRPVPVAQSPIEIPVADGLEEFRRRQVVFSAKPALSSESENRRGVEPTLSCLLVQAHDQPGRPELRENLAARIPVEPGSLGELLRGQRLGDRVQDAMAAVTLDDVSISFARSHSVAVSAG